MKYCKSISRLFEQLPIYLVASWLSNISNWTRHMLLHVHQALAWGIEFTRTYVSERIVNGDELYGKR